MYVLYVLEPKSTSGARYQSVTTLWGVQMSLYAIYGKYNNTHLVRESVDRYTERPRETEVGDPQRAVVGDEQVGGFHVAVEYVVLPRCESQSKVEKLRILFIDG